MNQLNDPYCTEKKKDKLYEELFKTLGYLYWNNRLDEAMKKSYEELLEDRIKYLFTIKGIEETKRLSSYAYRKLYFLVSDKKFIIYQGNLFQALKHYLYFKMILFFFPGERKAINKKVYLIKGIGKLSEYLEISSEELSKSLCKHLKPKE